MGYFYKFRKNESCLPALADYIKKKGNVVKADQCEAIHETVRETQAKELLLSLDDISLPTAYYMEEQNKAAVQERIDEYYKNGDFIRPLTVKRTSSGYILKGNFEQFRAAQELDLTECLCIITT